MSGIRDGGFFEKDARPIDRSLVKYGMANILIVEDDIKLARVVRDYLRVNGYHVEVETQGDVAAERIILEKPDLVILDINLPKVDGFSICRRVRDHYLGAIIILTARSQDVDEVLGLEIGADDYLSKPVRPAVLAARIGSHLRRNASAKSQHDEVIRVGDLVIHPRSHVVEMGNVPIEMGNAEFDLLVLLARNPGNAISRSDLFAQLNPLETYHYWDRSIDLRISRLRRKLNDTTENPIRILSIRGNGYMLRVTE